LYERIEVITSKTSAIATMRPGNGISSPAIPRGYPFPSQRSWWWPTASDHSPSQSRIGSTSVSPCSG
jgi:hypothetical protein